MVAGHDPLLDDGILFAKRLKKTGVNVTLSEYPAMPHGFLNFCRFNRDAIRAINEVNEFQLMNNKRAGEV